MQSKLLSATESVINTLSGFIIAWITTIFIIPIYTERELAMKDGFEITIVFTSMSLIRSYLWRRFFTKKGEH